MVELAKTAGFCFGVKRALETVYKEIETKETAQGTQQIYTYGPIVHNEHVVQALEARGVKVLNATEELTGITEGVVVIRAHGVSEAVYEQLRAHGLTVVDATCPFVRKIHKLVREHSAAGEHVMVVGNPEHPEVIGICGWAQGGITVVPDEAVAENLPPVQGKAVFVVAQTTYNVEKFKLIIAILQKKGYYVNVINTICSATSERQEEAAKLAARAAAMLVIGSSSSSNTKKLYEICKAGCPNTQLVQCAADVKLGEVNGIVGVTAGASTPNDMIEEVLTYVRNEF